MVSLRERLRQWEPERIAEVAQYWGVSAAGPDGSVDAELLALRMVGETPVRTAFDRLPAPEKDVLRAMNSAAHKGWVAMADLRRLAGVPESGVPEIVASLESRAMAFAEERDLPADNPYWGPTWAGRRLPTRPTPVLALPEEMAPLLLEVVSEFNGGAWYADPPSPLNRLESLPAETLARMAQHYGVSLAGVDDSPLKAAGRLQPALREHAAVWRVICALPASLRSVLDALEAAGGRLPMETVRADFAPEYRELHRLIAEMTERGLAFDRFVHRVRVLLVPDRILECLAEHTLPAMERGRLCPVPAPPAEELWHHDLQWGLLQVIRHIRLEGLSRTATTHTVPKRVAARLLSLMHAPPPDYGDEEWVEQMLLYLAAVGVLPDAAHLRLSPEPAWVSRDLASQASDLFQQWVEGRVEDLRQSHHDLGLWMDRDMLAAGRRLLADLLARCEPGQWYTISSLLKTAAGQRPFFLRDRERLVRHQGYRGLKRMLSNWLDVEGRVLIQHLTGLPFELGMVALDRPPAPGAPLPEDAAFRVTDWGAAILGRQPLPAPDVNHPLVVQPNFDVMVMELVPSVLDTLGQFAAPATCDRIATYRIERRCVNLAAANGWTGERMLAFLEEHARTPVPQNVAQTLRDWTGAVRRARLVRAVVIEADDASTLEELAASRVLKAHLRGMTGGAVLLVTPDADMKQVVRDLRPEGFVLEMEE